MDSQLTARNVELTPEVREYVDRKLGKLSRHLHKTMISKVELAEEKTRVAQHRFVVQVTIDSGGTILRGEERGEDLFTAIDKVAAVMERQFERYKGRLYDKGRGISLARGLPEEAPASATPRVVKTKRFMVAPMSVTEAIEQMELLDHDFFLFLNAETEKINLIYCRDDGNYGLIVPEIGK